MLVFSPHNFFPHWRFSVNVGWISKTQWHSRWILCIAIQFQPLEAIIDVHIMCVCYNIECVHLHPFCQLLLLPLTVVASQFPINLLREICCYCMHVTAYHASISWMSCIVDIITVEPQTPLEPYKTALIIRVSLVCRLFPSVRIFQSHTLN